MGDGGQNIERRGGRPHFRGGGSHLICVQGWDLAHCQGNGKGSHALWYIHMELSSISVDDVSHFYYITKSPDSK